MHSIVVIGAKREKRHDRHVYFVRAKRCNLIKIGVSDDAFKRLKELQMGCPDELELLGIYPCFEYGAKEKELHQRFAKYRVRGEWFKPVKAIFKVIEEGKRWENEWDQLLPPEQRGLDNPNRRIQEVRP